MKFVHDLKGEMQTATVQYIAPRPVNIGDVFYRIERGKTLNFYEPCRVCGGARNLTVNGVTFPCPYCDKEKTTITLAPYVVRRYRVNVIKEEALDHDWKTGDRYTYFRLYRKIGRGYYHYYDNGGSFELRSDEFCRRYNAPFDGTARADFGIYDNYKLAMQIADQMTACELARLQEYNEKFGTFHEASFVFDHDPKSN